MGLSPRDAALIAAAVAAGRVTVAGGTAPVIGDRVASSMTEAEFTRQVIEAARAAGWLVAHFGPARVMRRGVEKYETPVRGDGKGFVDLVLAKVIDGTPRVMLVELKTDKGRLSGHQERWLAASGAVVWRPHMWPEIVAVLNTETQETRGNQPATYDVPPIVVRDVAERLNRVNQELNLP